MSDRRRNIFVLLTVVGLIAASLAVIFTKETKLGLDLQGGVQLVFQGKPTKQQPDGHARRPGPRARHHARARRHARRRRAGAAALGQRPDRRRACRASPTPERAAEHRRHHGPAVLLRLGAEHPRRGLQDQPGRGQRRPAGDLAASSTPSSAPRSARRRSTTTTPPTARSFYAFDKDSNAAAQRGHPVRERGGPPREPREGRRDRRLRDPRGPRGRHRRPRAPTSATGDQRDRGEVDQWWVLKDNPVLSGNDIKNPEQNFENGTGGAPIVTMEFTDQGREAFARDDARDRPARRRTTRSSTAACRTRSRPRTTSRSGSTTS